jgi:hypothetical protein
MHRYRQQHNCLQTAPQQITAPAFVQEHILFMHNCIAQNTYIMQCTIAIGAFPRSHIMQLLLAFLRAASVGQLQARPHWRPIRCGGPLQEVASSELVRVLASPVSPVDQGTWGVQRRRHTGTPGGGARAWGPQHKGRTGRIKKRMGQGAASA